MAPIYSRDYEADKAELQRFLKEFHKTEEGGEKYFPYLEQLVFLLPVIVLSSPNLQIALKTSSAFLWMIFGM